MSEFIREKNAMLFLCLEIYPHKMLQAAIYNNQADVDTVGSHPRGLICLTLVSRHHISY